jgi:hypothetical protein
MDLHLQTVRTGETAKLVPERTLIGAADHANIRLADDAPYLAALVVRYPTGWALFCLCDGGAVALNRKPLRPGQRVAPQKGDLLTIQNEKFTFVAPSELPPADSLAPPTTCFAYITDPEGKEECRALDHDLLFGRLELCHVQLADSRLSRLAALLAADSGNWYLHNLTKGVLARNRKAVRTLAQLADGDQLQIGPLAVRIELRVSSAVAAPAARGSADPTVETAHIPTVVKEPPAAGTDTGEATEDGAGEPTRSDVPDFAALRARAQQLEQWLKSLSDPVHQSRGGISRWLGSQRDKLRRFWLDTPETTAARSQRAAGKPEEAFGTLDRAIRMRPESPELLRELYRLYDAIGFHDLCYRPLHQIEKLADARGTPDTWVLETLARLCERLGATRPAMFDRAIGYWQKLEAATGESTSRQRANVLALRAIRDRGYTGATE